MALFEFEQRIVQFFDISVKMVIAPENQEFHNELKNLSTGFSNLFRTLCMSHGYAYPLHWVQIFYIFILLFPTSCVHYSFNIFPLKNIINKLACNKKLEKSLPIRPLSPIFLFSFVTSLSFRSSWLSFPPFNKWIS